MFLVSVGSNDLISYRRNSARPPIETFITSTIAQFEALMRVRFQLYQALFTLSELKFYRSSSSYLLVVYLRKKHKVALRTSHR